MCRLYLEASKILHDNSRDPGGAALAERLLQDKTCIFKKRKQLSALVTITNSNATKLARQLGHTHSLEKSDMKQQTEKFWLHAVILQDFSNRHTKKRLQKHCDLYETEEKLQEFAFQNRRGTATEQTQSQIGNDKRIDEMVDYMRFVEYNVENTADNVAMDANDVTEWTGSEFDEIKYVEDQLCLTRKYLFNQCSHKQLVSAMKSLKANEFLIDPILPKMFIFPGEVRIKKSSMYKRGLFYSQDRASAMAAHVLNVPSGATVLDACAAPGSKTSCILDCYLAGTGKVYAVEKDAFRFETMKTLLSRFPNVNYVNDDFTNLRPDHYKDVTHILVDPSCTGTGMIGFKSHKNDEERVQMPRLRALQKFQAELLLHALTFPRARVVVYSTCSVKVEENEEVIRYVLNQVSSGWTLETIPENFSSSRGNEMFPEIAPHCLRYWPAKDFTDGFFVCKFVRLDDVSQ